MHSNMITARQTHIELEHGAKETFLPNPELRAGKSYRCTSTELNMPVALLRLINIYPAFWGFRSTSYKLREYAI
jgi:hypothetical protein